MIRNGVFTWHIKMIRSFFVWNTKIGNNNKRTNRILLKEKYFSFFALESVNIFTYKI